MKRPIEMTRLLVFMAAMTAISLSAGCGSTTYYLTINGRTDNGPGGPIASTLLTGVSFGSRLATVGNNGGILTSADGMSWQAAPSGTTSNLNSVAFGNFRFLAAGAAGTNLYAN